MGTPDALPSLSAGIPKSTAASDMEPPRKRQRLSPEAHGSISTRTTHDLETSLEVDHMILDFLTYQAIRTCIAARRSPLAHGDADVESALLQVDEFLALFKHRYPRYRLDVEARFRQQLLQLIALFTQRATRNSTTPPRASLKTLRQNNQKRAQRWIGSADRLPTTGYPIDPFEKELPVPSEKLEENRGKVLQSLEAPAENHAYDDEFYGTKECVSLLDLLPLFVKVSATCRNVLIVRKKEFNVGSNWMHLAAEWMLQACLEQYLAFGASGTDAIDEAFAWGYKEKIELANGDATQQEEDIQANNVFYDPDVHAELTGWHELREGMLEELFLAADGTHDLVTALEELQGRYTIDTVEAGAISFLEALSQVVPEPVLVQLEKGQLDGKSKEETSDFLKSCGVNMADLFGEA